MLPKVSVVICTRNEEQNIGNCLEALKSQNYPPNSLEIIVVDLGSIDKTKEIACGYTNEIYDLTQEVNLVGVKNPRGAQLNVGVKKALGSIIFYPDADMTFDENLIREAVELLREYDALYVPEIICGRGFFGKVRNFERSFYNATPIDAVRFVKKSVFEAVGGFDEKNIAFGFDDWDFTKSLKRGGYRLGITTASLYHHEEILTPRDYLAKKSRYAKTSGSYLEKWGRDDPDVRRQFGPWYRFLGVFVENGKWRRLVRHPILMVGMFFLRVLVGFNFLKQR